MRNTQVGYFKTRGGAERWCALHYAARCDLQSKRWRAETPSERSVLGWVYFFEIPGKGWMFEVGA